MRPTLSPELQVLLVDYIAEKKQSDYRFTLWREADRDVKNKLADFEISSSRTIKALDDLIKACGE